MIGLYNTSLCAFFMQFFVLSLMLNRFDIWNATITMITITTKVSMPMSNVAPMLSIISSDPNL